MTGPAATGPGHARVASVVARAVAACNLIAFASYGSQIQGLNGSEGVLPAWNAVAQYADEPLWQRLWDAPTLWWAWPTDAGLHAICALGTLCAAIALLGFLPGPLLLVCAVCYLSLTTIAQDFMHLQWDSLLVEVTAAAAFVAPWRLRPALVEPSAWALTALRFTAFRLMWMSGIVKLRSGDPHWHDLSAMQYHYWTQPLPNPLSPYMHRLSPDWHTDECIAMFAIELVAPFLLLGPPQARRVGCAVLIGLMGILFATGNYGFFQLLSVAACLAALDDDALAWLAKLPVRLPRLVLPTAHEPHVVTQFACGAVGVALIGLQAVVMTGHIVKGPALPEQARTAHEYATNFHLANRYGLFMTMTTDRPELVFEGSADGVAWKAYELPYKPGDLNRGLPVVAPHMPRLDWQLWFAALGTCSNYPFVQNVMFGLQEGSPDVLSLFADNPFPDAPPAYVRVRQFRYTFTGTTPGAVGGALSPDVEVGRTWTRQLVDPAYCPLVSAR